MHLPTPILSAPQLAAGDLLERCVVLDARAGEAGRKAYTESHLEGARHADLDRHLADTSGSPASGGRHPLPDLEAWSRQLGSWGITPSTAVAIYDAAGGGLAAARAWWMVRACGHRQVAVLDGGWNALVQAGLPLNDRVPEVADTGPYPVTGWQLPLANADEVERRRLDPDWRVVDVRSADRYRGESEPFDPVRGRIPGAINMPYSENLGPDGRFRPAAELAELYQERLEVDPERTIIHCGSGVTACHTLLALEIAGLQPAHLYVGSWSEWCLSDRQRTSGD